MTSSVSNTTSTATAYKAKGYTGLGSGIDTEAVVESMTADIQAKIDKVKQQQQTFTWKQEAYRDVISSLIGFQSKYFSYTSSTNLMSSSFYNCTTMVPGGSNAGKIAVSGVSSASTANYSITGVSQLAKTASKVMSGPTANKTIKTDAINFGDRQVSAVAGGTVSIKYGGSTYKVKIASDAETNNGQEFIDALNAALKDVNLSGISGKLGDKLDFSLNPDGRIMLSKKAGDSNSFSITGGTAAVLNALQMEKDDASQGSIIVGKGPIDESLLIGTLPFDMTNKSLTLNLNGLNKTITFTAEDNKAITDLPDDASKLAKMQELTQQKIDAQFGSDKIKVGIDGNGLAFTTVKKQGDGSVVADETAMLQISSGTAYTMGPKGVFSLENGAKNRLDLSAQLKDLGLTPSGTDENGNNQYKLSINGVDFTFGETATVSEMLNTINGNAQAGVNITYLSTSGTFTMMATESGAQGRVHLGDEDGNTDQWVKDLFGTQRSEVQGQDLKMTIRYQGSTEDMEVIRNSNTVSLDGINFTAKEEFTAAAEADYVTFSPKSDTENIITAIKSMVEDYNKILDTVNSLVTTSNRSNVRGSTTYLPLTDAQRKEMSADEIKVWEERAKQGILFQDSTLSQLASDLRFVFSTAVAGVGMASSIGLSSASSYSGNGKISIDENKLKAALESNPDKVRSIFTASAEASPGSSGSSKLAGGLVNRMKTIMESYARDTGSNKGSLVGLAGLANNATTTDNYINRQQKILSQKLSSLQTLLQTRQDRYQSQFTRLESYIANMNAQSSWLASSFS